MTVRTQWAPVRAVFASVALLGAVAVTTVSMAQTAPTPQAPAAAQQATTGKAAPSAIRTDGGLVNTSVPVLSLADLESRVSAQGFTVKELEIEGLLAKVSAYDAQGQKVKLTLDRRTGETLAARIKRNDDSRHH